MVIPGCKLRARDEGTGNFLVNVHVIDICVMKEKEGRLVIGRSQAVVKSQ